MKTRYFMRSSTGVITETDDVYEWRMWSVDADRSIAQDAIRAQHPITKKMTTFEVSTVFIGFSFVYDQKYDLDGNPLLFETMIFNKLDGEVDWSGEFEYRYATEEQAREGHRLALTLIRDGTMIKQLNPRVRLLTS